MAKEIHSGDIKHRIVLKQPTTTVNNEAGRELTYPTNTIETFAAIKDVRQYRTEEGSAVTILNVKEFFIRWTEDREVVNKDWLLVYDSRNYTIHEVSNLNNEKKFIRIAARVKT